MLLPLVNQLSTTCGIFTKSEDSSLLKLPSPLSLLLLPQELTTVTLYFMAYQNVSWKTSNMFKTLLQGSSTYLKSSIMLLLSLSVCTGFPLNRGSTSKFSSSPYKALNGKAPKYISDLLSPYSPGRNLRSANQKLLCKASYNLKTDGARSFSCAAPLLWNSIPYDLRNSSAIDTFKRKLKTWLFCKAFSNQ